MSKQSLIELREAVKTGNRSHSLNGTPLRGYGELYQKAYNGSLDAAKKLHEALLPYSVIWDMSHSIFGFEVSILENDNQCNGCDKHSPARAWLIAILSALIDQSTDTP